MLLLLLPSGSTDLAKLSASEVAKSVLAGVTARMRQVSLVMNCMIMSLIWASMSTGWSPTGILVRPGRSISVMFKTEENKKWLVSIADASTKIVAINKREKRNENYWID